jgi:hypothetical protein
MKLPSVGNILKGYTHRDRSKLYIQSSRDWTVILIVTFLLLGSVGFYNYHVFMTRYVRGADIIIEESGGEGDANLTRFKKELDDTLSYFEAKKEYHMQLLKEKKTFESFLSAPLDFSGGVPEQEVSTSSDTVGSFDRKRGERGFFGAAMKNISNTASVWSSFFVDLLR